MTSPIVTGAGLATAAGAGCAATWDRWLAGAPSLTPPADRWAHWPCALLGRAELHDCGPLLPVPKLAKYAGRSVTLLAHAAREALDQAAAAAPGVEPAEVGVYVASGETGLEPSTFFAALDEAWRDGEPGDYATLGGRPSRLIDPYFSLTTLSNLGVAFLSMMARAEGPSLNVVHDATAGVAALAAALDDLRRGIVARAVVGAHDSWLVEQAALGLARRGWLLPRGGEAVRPFDEEGEGLAPAEGAAVLVLDRGDVGLRPAVTASRPQPTGGASVDVEISGAATAMPAGGDPPGSWPERATREACRAAGGREGDVLLAHGTGVASLDRTEAQVLATAMPGAAAVTSMTGCVGSLGAATSLVQAVVATLMLRAQRVPAVTGQRRPIGLLPWVHGDAVPAAFDAVTLVCRAAQGQVGAVRLRGVPSSTRSTS